MIELDLKGAGWLGRSLAAVACHRQWRSVRRASGFTSRVSRARMKRRAMRFSVRHLSGLIYDAVDDFVRGPISDQRAQPLLPEARCASKPRRSRPVVLGRFSCRGPKALSYSRRSLSPEEFGKCRIDEFISRCWEVEPIGSMVAQ
jgi:hypothetical protein